MVNEFCMILTFCGQRNDTDFSSDSSSDSSGFDEEQQEELDSFQKELMETIMGNEEDGTLHQNMNLGSVKCFYFDLNSDFVVIFLVNAE